MATIGTKNKQEIVESFRHHEKDSGSCEVQIALLTERINHLVEHLKQHKKDHHTRRGLLILVGRRRKFMSYLHKNNPESLLEIANRLNLKLKDYTK